jgi:hypothetical protein
MKTNYRSHELPKPEKIPNYVLIFQTNANYHKTWENCLDVTGSNGEVSGKKVGSIEATQKNKLQITLLDGTISEFQKHSIISLSPTGALEIRYRTDRELYEIMIELDSLLIPNDKELVVIVKNFKRVLKIVELENNIKKINEIKSMLNAPRVGIGTPESFIAEQNRQYDEELSKLMGEHILLSQNRYIHKIGEKWDMKLTKERLRVGFLT